MVKPQADGMVMMVMMMMKSLDSSGGVEEGQPGSQNGDATSRRDDDDVTCVDEHGQQRQRIIETMQTETTPTMQIEPVD